MRSIILFFLMPILIGGSICLSQDHKSPLIFLAEKYVIGWIIMLAFYWPCSLVWLSIGGQLWSLTLVWLFVMIILSIFGFIRITKRYNPTYLLPKTWSVELILALVLIGAQMQGTTLINYINADDATYLNQTISVWKSGRVLLYRQEGTLAQVEEMMEYFMSQWTTMGATFAKLTGVHPTILLHSVLPSFLIILAYSVYALLGYELFGEEKKTVRFVMAMSLVNICGAFSEYSVSCFLLWRIWQGKAILYSIMLPLFITWMLRYQKEWEIKVLFMLFALVCAALNLTQISVMTIGILWGVYVLKDLDYQLKNNDMKTNMAYLFMQALLLIPLGLVGVGYAIIRWRG